MYIGYWTLNKYYYYYYYVLCIAIIHNRWQLGSRFPYFFKSQVSSSTPVVVIPTRWHMDFIGVLIF